MKKKVTHLLNTFNLKLFRYFPTAVKCLIMNLRLTQEVLE